jgi:hypothetical protein
MVVKREVVKLTEDQAQRWASVIISGFELSGPETTIIVN